MDLNIETVEKPVVVRAAGEPNPFDGAFPVAEGQAISVVLPSNTEDEKKAVKRVVTLAQKAANTVGRTARVKREEETTGTGKNAKVSTRLTFWDIPKVSRPRKTEDENATTEPTDTASE